jgi:hypothetical protein
MSFMFITSGATKPGVPQRVNKYIYELTN